MHHVEVQILWMLQGLKLYLATLVDRLRIIITTTLLRYSGASAAITMNITTTFNQIMIVLVLIIIYLQACSAHLIIDFDSLACSMQQIHNHLVTIIANGLMTPMHAAINQNPTLGYICKADCRHNQRIFNVGLLAFGIAIGSIMSSFGLDPSI